MRKAGAFLLLLLISQGFVQLSAQEGEPDWDYYYTEDRAWGDQTFTISLGTIFPTIFYGSEGTIDHQLDPPIGGTGSLAYNFYFTSNLFAGAEVGFQFFPTYAENTLFIIPLGFRGGYQFNVGKFEFPIAAVIGMVWHRYLNLGYYGLYLKGSGSVFYRAFPNWSFGINTSWYWYPQWIKDDSSKDVYGNMIDITLSARYHF